MVPGPYGLAFFFHKETARESDSPFDVGVAL